MSITLRQMRVFEAVATLGSISKGARAIGMSQSAASEAIADMQARLGRTLFLREKGQPVRLTAEGLRIRPLVHSILKDVTELGSNEEPVALEGELVVGATMSIGDHVLPRLCAAFRRRYPAVALQVIVASDGELIRAFEHLDLETALIEHSTSVAQVELVPWRRDDLWLVASPDHPLAARSVLHVRDLAGHLWCLRERAASVSIRLKLELSALGRLEPAIEINSNFGLIEAASAGMGIACLSSDLVAPVISAGRLVRLDPADFSFTRDLHLARRKGMRRDRLAATFDAFVMEFADEASARDG